MNNLQVFKNELFQVSVKLENGQTIFDAETVAKSLGLVVSQGKYTNVRWDRVNKYLVNTGLPQVEKGDFIPESAVYKLAFKASNEVAEKFQDWLAVEVLPSIRKNGVYMTEDAIEKALNDPDFIIRLATNLKEEKIKRIEAENKIVLQQPKVIFADAVSVSHTSILVGELAKLLKQNGINIGQNRLFERLRTEGYLIRRIGTDYNMPTQKSMELKLFQVKETAITHSDGHVTISKTTKVNGKGQIYFVNKFREINLGRE
jgi:anti-repressor protein